MHLSTNGRKGTNYPSEENEKYHRDVERHHDEEIENAVLENGSH